LEVRGGRVGGGAVAGAGDHRCAMSFCVLGQVAQAPVTVSGCHNIATSYPGFVNDMTRLGGHVEAAA
jgi:5-enolpyruvylshikimate-3-phosphate synthase